MHKIHKDYALYFFLFDINNQQWDIARVGTVIWRRSNLTILMRCCVVTWLTHGQTNSQSTQGKVKPITCYMMTLTCIGNYITCNAASTGCGDQTACLSTLQQAMGPQLLVSWLSLCTTYSATMTRNTSKKRKRQVLDTDPNKINFVLRKIRHYWYHLLFRQKFYFIWFHWGNSI